MTESEFVIDLFPEEEYKDSHIVRDSGPVHPAMTTPFVDYTVTEALLLFSLLLAFVTACFRILKGGFPWLR